MSSGGLNFPPAKRLREIPFMVGHLLTGARVVDNYKGKKEFVGIFTNDGSEHELSVSDYEVVKLLYSEVVSDLFEGSAPMLIGPDHVLKGCQLAYKKLESMGDDRKSKYGVAALKDSGGSGYWRMDLPSGFINSDELFMDVTQSSLDFDSLLEYETIFVQRVHDWDSYYVLRRLKEAGRRVVYDIDDDIFNITPDNPIFSKITHDHKSAAVECMRLADVVTTTTETLKSMLIPIIGEYTDIQVIPNSMNPHDGWLPVHECGSPDDKVRIFYQGSSTHGEDWMECIQAVDEAMRLRDDLILIVLGSLPPIIAEYHNSKDYWHGRVQFQGFSDPETFFHMVRGGIRAEVGLAPLQDTLFNRSKSPIKWMEYALIGMPTVASNVSPYSDVIDHGRNGYLAGSVDSWLESIMSCLDGSNSPIISSARADIDSEFNLVKNADTWESVLRGI